MMKTRGIVAVLTVVVLGLSVEAFSADRPATITRDRYTGCRSQQELRKLNGYAARGDKNAWSNAMAGANMRGECTIFRKGEAVA